VPIQWEVVDVKPVKLSNGTMGINPDTIATIKRNKVGLKGKRSVTSLRKLFF
jgi:hypothetical protein